MKRISGLDFFSRVLVIDIINTLKRSHHFPMCVKDVMSGTERAQHKSEYVFHKLNYFSEASQKQTKTVSRFHTKTKYSTLYILSKSSLSGKV